MGSRLYRLLLPLLAAASLCACESAQDSRRTASLDLEPCRLRGGSGLTSVAAECGRLPVAENPAAQDSNTIELFVARVPALNPRFPTTAFTTIAGGPGQASTEFYADYAVMFERINRHHDIVLVDQRGTGQSNLLDCPYDLDNVFEFSVDTAAAIAAECLAGLPADPRYYTTSVAVDDLDHVRAALGYETLDIYGASYGTRVAQHYLKQYPDRVRTVIIDGVVPAGELLGPKIALEAQAALDNLFARCGDDPHCNERFPQIGETFVGLAERLWTAPVQLMLPDPVDGALTEVTMDYTSFAGTVRLLSYTPGTVALLPLLLHEADSGNWGPLVAQAQMAGLALADTLAEGMHNAIMCSEDAPFFQVDAAQRKALDATYLGTLQLDAIEKICANWPAGLIDQGFHEPATQDVPVLLLSGSADPITPPSYGEQAARHLPDSLHIVAEGHGHGVITRGCVPELVQQLVESASLTALDPGCVGRQSPAPFFTSFAGPQP